VKNKKYICVLVLILVLAPLLSACNPNKEGIVFGTYYSLDYKGKGAAKLEKEAFSYMSDMENLLSSAVTQSDVSRVNDAKAGEAVAVSDLFIALFKLSASYNQEFPAFDPAVFPLVALWKFTPETFVGAASSIPSQSEIDALLPLADLSLFSLDEINKTVTKAADGAMLDFGAVAKGYAVDRVYEKAAGFKKITVNVGGTIKSNKSLKIAITAPRGGGYFASFALNAGEAVSTSGDYERYYIYEGKRYCHIIAPDGYPAGALADNPVVSVTVVGPSAAVCDILSTALFITGDLASLPYGYSALTIYADQTYASAGEKKFEIL
jgi:Membrane-associated lipoprotein involved in thiamine biosynthesis